jgi:sodium-dependent dicarboxylate transporter 2/3/5
LIARRIGLVLGLLLFFYTLFSPQPANMSEQAWITAGVGMLMVVWWVTQVLPVPVTSLLPIILFPLLGISSIREAAAPYANPVIFLLLGGFIIATALQRWQLHKRLALTILMWISNTATTIMMLPIALSLAQVMLEGQSKEATNKFTVCLMLGIAYAASIGGLGTLIGTPPNVMVAAFMSETYGINIGFTQWMSFGLPIVFILVPLSWLLLTRLLFTFDLEHNAAAAGVIDSELRAIGPMTTPEKRTATAFVIVAMAWVTRPFLQQIPGLAALDDTIIAVAAAVSLFLIPSGDAQQKNVRLLDWSAVEGIPWGVLLLFGGGLSLAAMVSSSGLAVWLGTVLSILTSFHVFVLMLSIVAMVVFLTELTSNTATTATLLPVLGGIATAAYIEPLLLIAPMALAASCAFMLPVATAPNAIVFGSGKVSIPQMAKAGFCLNLIAIMLIPPLAYLLIPLIFL